jgi:hypothetical protein
MTSYISDKENPNKSLLATVEEQYVENGGNENMAKEVDKLLQQYPELTNEKEQILTMLKTYYSQGFLKGYLDVIQ